MTAAFTTDDIAMGIELPGVYDGIAVWLLQDGTLTTQGEVCRMSKEDNVTEPSLPDRMREAAEVLREADKRCYVHIAGWTPGELVLAANAWESEDRAKAEQEALVEELASRIYHYVTGNSWLAAGSVDNYRDCARKLIEAGWRKGGSGE